MSKREFVLQDGKSDKFWNIEVSGTGYEVHYGRAGTTGQTQTKSFDSAVAAQTTADKLIAEKVKKGYVESGTAASTASAVKPAPKRKVEAAPVTMEEAAPVLPPIDAIPERALRLDDLDWLWATWRPQAQLPKPEPAPFDCKVAMKRARKIIESPFRWDWSRAALKPPYSKEEAHFWLAIYLAELSYEQVPYHQRAAKHAQYLPELLEKLESMNFDGRMMPEDIVERVQCSDDIGLPDLLFALFPIPQALQIILDIEDRFWKGVKYPNYHHFDRVKGVVQVLRERVLPWISGSELEAVRQMLRPYLDAIAWTSSVEQGIPVAAQIAAVVGMSDYLEAKINDWEDPQAGVNPYAIASQKPQQLIFGLGSAQLVNQQMRRLRLHVARPEYIRAWLAHTEFSQLDYITDSILNATTTGYNYNDNIKDITENLIKAFGLAEAPEVAPHMLRLMLESKGSRAAREWLDTHPLHAIYGLLPVAVGRGKLAEAAIQYLNTLHKRGFAEHLRVAAKSLPEAEQAKLDAEIFNSIESKYVPFTDETAPEPVREALKGLRAVRQRLGWIGAADLPPITYGGHRLSDSQVEALLSVLRSGGDALTRAVKSTADAASLDEFAWQLFQRWLIEGAPSKEKWAMLAIGQLGGDKSAIRLAPLIRVWPGESQHQRAVTGLQCLRGIGSDTALMQLNGIAQKVKFKGLQTKAQEYMEAIANDKGLSRSQLEDRVVPDCGLDERGSRVFDFGPRQFRFILGPDMKPMVRGEGTKLAKPKPNLPAPNSKDDASKAEEALADWKLLKKQLSELTKIQTVRLEQAMVKGRRWTLEEFETLLARHPLMTNFVRLLVWEVAAGNRRATFRVTEDGTYADCNDETFDLAGGGWAHVGIAHPLNIPDGEKRAWGEIFSDYEIVPPFAQLGRAIYNLEAEEAQEKIITRFKDQNVQPQTLCFGLEKLGWERGPGLDNGGFYEHYKYFEDANLTACVVYEPGLSMGGQEYWDPQQVEKIYFVPGNLGQHQWYYPDDKKAVALSEIDAVALSEVLKDVTEIVAKGEIK